MECTDGGSINPGAYAPGSPEVVPLRVRDRRRGRRLAYLNGGVWAVGSGLLSSTLVIYLAMQFGAEGIGLGIALILSIRYMVGPARLLAPAVIGRWIDRKRFCIAAYLLSAVLLGAIPALAVPALRPPAGGALAAVVAVWSLYHLLEYAGTIALYSWLADLVPTRVRGRFLGRRERWMVAGAVTAMLASAACVWGCRAMLGEGYRWVGYAVSAAAGAAALAAAVVPLAAMPHPAGGAATRRGATVRETLRPLVDSLFLRLLIFGCCFSFANGLTQSPTYTYQGQVLGVALAVILALRTVMRLGQFTISPWMGRLSDRLGNRLVLAAATLLTAQGPLFYLLAAPGASWWIGGAWLVWIAYAGVNVALYNLMLRLAPHEASTTYIAVYFTATGLAHAAGALPVGQLADRFAEETFAVGPWHWGFHDVVFLLGWLARLAAVVVLLVLVREPPPSTRRPSLRPPGGR
ncbi:MAG: MFS transporter [Pirellulales bacterium]